VDARRALPLHGLGAQETVSAHKDGSGLPTRWQWLRVKLASVILGDVLWGFIRHRVPCRTCGARQP
jgi:hypothetical protein